MVTRLKFRTLSEWDPMRNLEFDQEEFPNCSFGFWLAAQLLELDVSKEDLIDEGLKERTIRSWINHQVKKPRANQLYRLIDALARLRGVDREALRASLFDALKRNKDRRYRQL